MLTPMQPNRRPLSLAATKLRPLGETPKKDADCCQGDACCTGAATQRPPEAINLSETAGLRFTWQVEGMDCPACARKVETAVRKVHAVEQVQVLFSREKLVVDASADVRQHIERAVKDAGYQLRDHNAPPDDADKSLWREYGPIALLAAMMLISWGIARVAPQVGNVAFILTTLVGLWPVARQALRLIRAGSVFGIETLMSIAAIGALFIGATAEAAMVLLLYMLGEQLEGYAAKRARRGVSALMALKPDTATRLRNGQRETLPASELQPGDVIEIAAGDRLPADATLNAAFASFDESALTGESMPVEHRQGESVPAGSTSVDQRVTLTVVSRPGESAIDRILSLIEEAESHRAPVERFIDRFSRIYTPIIMALALLTTLIPPLLFAASWHEWIYKGLTLLLIGCPCALVISTPAAITSALAAAARRGALIKGGAALEQLGRVQHIAFDKTGTLTVGQPTVTEILPAGTLTREQLLVLAAAVEQGATHPLAKAIVRDAAQQGLTLPEADNQRVIPGKGIEASVNGQVLRLCSPGAAPAHVLTEESRQQIERQESLGQTVILLLQDNALLGMLALQDTLRSDAQQAIKQLQAMGITGTILTGDNPRAAAAIAQQTGLSWQANLLPADKVAAVNALNARAPLAMVGDGINDAPAMKAATAGIAMGSGTDVALETADAAITHNRLNTLAEMIYLARSAHSNIRQNIAIALGLKGIFLVTSLLGITGLWLAVLADSGATALVTANALRLLRTRSPGA